MKQYKAFLSYAHHDEKLARKLHRVLENYRPPKGLKPAHGKTLRPIFRDQDEMSAGSNLSDKIKTALEQSEYLIVLASPAAQKSHWVNDEIRFFRQLKGDSKILSALIHESPTESFPPALLETGLEPLAANLTQGQFRLGVTQIAASMMNVGLDDLIQRDLKKLRRRVTAITVGSVSALLIMGSLTWTAISAQHLAEQRRQDAEGQIEYMITDLKDELESVGKLAPLNSVGQRAVNYYDGYPLSSHNTDALARRAKVFHLLGDVQDQQGNFESAVDYFRRAFDATKALLKKSPKDPDRIFDHAQSAFWVGNASYNQENYAQAETYFQTYYDLANELEVSEGETPRVIQEKIYALSNLGNIALAENKLSSAREYLSLTAEQKLSVLLQNPNDEDQKVSIADTYTSIANLELQESRLPEAALELKKTINVLESIEAEDFQLQVQKLIARRSLANVYFFSGEFEKAIENVRIASDISEALTTIEPNNVELKYEMLSLEFVKFHLAFVEDDAASSRLQYAKIQTGLSNMPKSKINDYSVETLQRSYANLPLYIAILDKDKAEQRKQGLILLTGTEAELSRSLSSDNLNKYLPSYLLSLSVLDEIERSEYLETICNAKDIHLGFQQVSALSTVFSEEQCPAAKLTRPHPTTSPRLAIQRIQSQ